MKLFAGLAMPEPKSGPVSYRYASHTVHGNVWGSTRIDPVWDLDLRAGTVEENGHWGHLAHRFLAHFTGPIIWAIEIAAVLLIIADHSGDFVDGVIAADLVIIVLMMAFRAALGLWKEHHGGTLERKKKTSAQCAHRALGA